MPTASPRRAPKRKPLAIVVPRKCRCDHCTIAFAQGYEAGFHAGRQSPRRRIIKP